MAGVKKTIYLSEKNLATIDYLEKSDKMNFRNSDAKPLDRMLSEFSKMLYVNIMNISEGAYIALSKGEFDKLHLITFEDGRKIIVLKEDYHKEYAHEIGEMIDKLHPADMFDVLVASAPSGKTIVSNEPFTVTEEG